MRSHTFKFLSQTVRVQDDQLFEALREVNHLRDAIAESAYAEVNKVAVMPPANDMRHKVATWTRRNSICLEIAMAILLALLGLLVGTYSRYAGGNGAASHRLAYSLFFGLLIMVQCGLLLKIHRQVTGLSLFRKLATVRGK